jgi:actin-related protein
VLDHAFDRLALSGNAVDHPVVLTETVANLPSTRTNLVELMFEAYGVPSLAIGPAAAFSHVHARKRGQSGLDALLVSSGCSVSHVLPRVRRISMPPSCSGGIQSHAYPKHRACTWTDMAWARLGVSRCWRSQHA